MSRKSPRFLVEPPAASCSFFQPSVVIIGRKFILLAHEAVVWIRVEQVVKPFLGALQVPAHVVGVEDVVDRIAIKRMIGPAAGKLA